MYLFQPTAGDFLLLSPGESPPGLRQAARAYRRAMAGLHSRAARAFAQTLGTLEKEKQASGGAYASALALAGLAARAACRWPEADGLLAQASDVLFDLGEQSLGSLCLALRSEALACTGQLALATDVVEAWSTRARDLPALAQAVLQVARGHLEEGQELSSKAAQEARTPLLRTWAELLLAESLLDQGHPDEARPPLKELVARLEQGRSLDEAYVRALWLAARAEVEALWPLAGPPAPRELRLAQDTLLKAERYTLNFARYRAQVKALRVQLGTLARPGKSGPAFERAMTALEQCGARLDRARLAARQATFLLEHAHHAAQPLLLRARDLLSQTGAEARCHALAHAGLAPGRSLHASRSSVRQRSSLTEDVELEAVFEVNRAITSTLALDVLLGKILDEVLHVLKAERGAIIRRLPDGTSRCVAARHIDPDRVNEGENEISFGVLAEVERTGEVLLTDNAQMDERLRGRGSVLGTEIRSVMCAPIKTSKSLFGFLYVDSTIRSRVFREAHQELLEVFATQAAVALENALMFSELEQLNRTLEARVQERTADLAQANQALEHSLEELKSTRLRLMEAEKEALEKELHVARMIQESILPGRGLIRRPGLTFIGHLEAASQVGGDLWTYLALADFSTLLLVGDATGHGLGAGMMTTVVKACCETLVRQARTLDVQHLLRILSEVIHASAKGALAVTAFACLVDPRHRTLTYASAESPGAYLIEAGSGLPKLVPLLARGNRLGEGGHPAPHELQRRTYTTGDRLVLYTDGLVECADPDRQQLRERHFRRRLITTASFSLVEQRNALVADLDEFFGDAPRDDDVTLVLAELE